MLLWCKQVCFQKTHSLLHHQSARKCPPLKLYSILAATTTNLCPTDSICCAKTARLRGMVSLASKVRHCASSSGIKKVNQKDLKEQHSMFTIDTITRLCFGDGPKAYETQTRSLLVIIVAAQLLA